MKRIVIASVLCLLMAAGLSQCKCSHPVGASIVYEIHVVSERAGIVLDTIGIYRISKLYESRMSLNTLDKMYYINPDKDTTYFELYAGRKLICDTCLLLHQAKTGLRIETDSTFMLKFTLRADSTLTVEQKLLANPTSQSPVAVF